MSEIVASEVREMRGAAALPRDNGELTFDESSGRRYYGNVNGNTLVIDDQGVTMTYRRY